MPRFTYHYHPPISVQLTSVMGTDEGQVISLRGPGAASRRGVRAELGVAMGLQSLCVEAWESAASATRERERRHHPNTI